jgi:hypothetical protein
MDNYRKYLAATSFLNAQVRLIERAFVQDLARIGAGPAGLLCTIALHRACEQYDRRIAALCHTPVVQ